MGNVIAKETHFASPERTAAEQLLVEIETIQNDPLITGLLSIMDGLLAVVDENRQVVGINDSFIKLLGIESAEKAFGLRLGEALNCVHASDMEAGCGTSPYCSSCGAVVAMVASLEFDEPVERICALTAKRGEDIFEAALLVRSHPVKIENKRFLLLFIKDVTEEQQRRALEKIFFHDINNSLTTVVAASQMLVHEQPSELARMINTTTVRMAQEIAVQRSLIYENEPDVQPVWQRYKLEQIVDELRSFFKTHPSARDRVLVFPEDVKDVFIKTDLAMILRVNCNMILNALEATDHGGKVKVYTDCNSEQCLFSVWNDKWIPDNIQLRIFQRNFSTKGEGGRGLGTYSMKVLGEEGLGGKVEFESYQDKGTTFTFTFPLTA